MPQVAPITIYDTGSKEDTGFSYGPFAAEKFLNTPNNKEIIQIYEDAVNLAFGEDISVFKESTWQICFFTCTYLAGTSIHGEYYNVFEKYSTLGINLDF